jgi:hypothetical protein
MHYYLLWQINNLKQLAQLVKANEEPYLRFDFDEHVYVLSSLFIPLPMAWGVNKHRFRVIILEAEAAKQAEDTILTRHRIPSPHSPDLFDKKEDTQVV